MKYTDQSDRPYQLLALISLAAALAYFIFRIHDFRLYYEFMLGRSIFYDPLYGRRAMPFLVLGIDFLFVFEQGLFIFSNWKQRIYKFPEIFPLTHPEKFPYIAILIPTFNESLSVIEPTLREALTVDYPQDRVEVLLLDDGDSFEKQDLANRLKKEYSGRTIKYCSRIQSGYGRVGFKAGNLNFGLDQATPGFWGVLFLDCDHVCGPHILKDLVRYALKDDGQIDPMFGFVQAPQTYEIGSEDWWDRPCREFHTVTQAYRSYRQATMLTGTNALVSAQALRMVGGMDETTVTEDLITGAKIQSLGFKTYFHNTPVAFGLVPESLEDILKQRRRWAQGSFQFLKRVWNFVFRLNLGQQLTYLSGIFHFILGFGYLGLALVPPLILIKGFDPSLHYSNPSLVFLGAFIIFRYFSRERYCEKSSREHIAGAYLSFLYAPTYIGAFFSAIFLKRLSFWTSSKDGQSKSKSSLKVMAWPLFFSALNIFGIGMLMWHVVVGQYPWIEFIFDYVGLVLLSVYFSCCGLASLTVRVSGESN